MPWGRRPGRAQDGAGVRAVGQAHEKFRKCTCVPTRQVPAVCLEVHVRNLPGQGWDPGQFILETLPEVLLPSPELRCLGQASGSEDA